MKLRILLILLLISSFAFAQTWNQVGAAQFTDFASNGEMAFDSTGVPYLLYENSTTNQVSVMKFNGTSWLPVGSGAISTENYNNLTIKINPITNQPWVALKAEANGAASNIDVFSFDGSSWVSEGANIGGYFYSYGIQLQFSTAGVPRIVGMIASVVPYYKPSFYTKNGANWSVTTYPIYTGAPRGVNPRIDFYDFDNYTMAAQSSVKNYNVSDSNQTAHETLLWTAGVNYRQVSANGGAKYFAVIDAGTNKITVGKSGGGVTQPSGVTGVTEEIVTFRESITDNHHYLMYSDGSHNLTFKKYKTSNIWQNLPSFGILTNTTGFFVKMEMNPVNGDMYVAYLDGGKVSVKSFSIQPPLAKYYVNANVSGGDGSGDSWANAITDLEDAINSVSPITTDIWVASGTYSPGSARSDSFEFVVNGLSVYGGFDGTETTLAQRNIAANPTILSGDVNGNDAVVDFATASGSSRIDNNHQVVKIAANNVTIDGFKIEDGDAVQNSTGYTTGAAILVAPTALNPKIQNCEFNNNVTYSGGAVGVRHTVSTDINITNCVFNNNVSRYGSGLYILFMSNSSLNVIITNTLFINNISKNYNNANDGYTGSAAWIRANESGSNLTTTITNCTFANNTDIGAVSASQKGALALGRRVDGSATHNATINNSIFYGNEGAGSATTASVNNGHTLSPNLTLVNNSIGEDNFSNLTSLINTSSVNPMFTSATDFTLQSGSPAIDAGDNSKIPVGTTTDLLGNARIFNTTVDMGVYEYGSTLDVEDFETKKDFIIYPNPTTSLLNIKMKADLIQAEIYNIQGQKVLESTVKSIPVSKLNSGMYVLQIEDVNGNRNTKRFIKN